MKTLEDFGLTEEDIECTQFCLLEHLMTESSIKAYLHASLLNIGDGDTEPSSFFHAVTSASVARVVNRLAKKTDIDHMTLCHLFYEDYEHSIPPEVVNDNIVKIAEALSIPIPDTVRELNRPKHKTPQKAHTRRAPPKRRASHE